MTTAADLISIEDAWVAEPIVEEPPGSNHTRLGVEFGFDHVAWCAITQTLAIGHAFGGELYRSAAVSQWIDAAKRGIAGMAWIPADGWIEAGMLVTFDFGPANGYPKGNPAHFHIGMVRDPGTQAKFQTDAGNEGDAMRQQWRDRRYVQGFIGLPYDVPVSQPQPTPEDDMPTATVTTADGNLHIYGTKAGQLYEDVYDVGSGAWKQYPLGVLAPGAHGLSAAVGADGKRVDLVYVDGTGQMHQGFYDPATMAWQWTGAPPGNWD